MKNTNQYNTNTNKKTNTYINTTQIYSDYQAVKEMDDYDDADIDVEEYATISVEQRKKAEIAILKRQRELRMQVKNERKKERREERKKGRRNSNSYFIFLVEMFLFRK